MLITVDNDVDNDVYCNNNVLVIICRMGIAKLFSSLEIVTC